MAEEQPTSDRKLADEILADARAKAEKIVQRCERDAEKINVRTDKLAQRESKKIIAHFRERAEKQQEMILASVDIEIEKKHLALKEKEIQSVIEEAKKRLLEKSPADYMKTLVRLAARAIDKMQGTDFTISLARSDESLAGDDLLNQIKAAVKGKNVTLKYDAAESGISAGVIIRSADARQLYDNSFERRLKRLENYIRKEVAETIFEETGNPDE